MSENETKIVLSLVVFVVVLNLITEIIKFVWIQ
jgi:hypothetical protein